MLRGTLRQGRRREAESTRPTKRPLDRVYGATEKSGENFDFEFSMSTNLKWLASTGSAANFEFDSQLLQTPQSPRPRPTTRSG
jgi:hypothetical protein